MHSWKRSEKKNFCACFYSLSKKKEIQTEPEAFYRRRRKGERRRIDSFFDRRKNPPFLLKKRRFETHTHTLPTLRRTETHTHAHAHARKGRTRAFKKRRRDTPVTRGSARARDATGGQGERTLNCRRHARVGSRRGRQRRRRRRRTFKVDDVDSKRCWRSETPVR